MMGIKNPIDKKQVEMLSLDRPVPEGHIIRKIEKAIKLNIIQYTFGIRSMRQRVKEIEVNNAYRWYIGYGLSEQIPHFSTFGKNYSRRFEGTDLFEQIFMRVVAEIQKTS